MSVSNDFVNIMKKYPLTLENSVFEKLVSYAALIVDYPVNLTALKDPVIAFESLVVDSILPVKENGLFESLNVNRIVDIGTGGGVPGIPLAIVYPDIEFTLVDSIGKKIDAVIKFKKELNLKNVKAFNARVEDFTANNREKFDLATCKAVARADISLEYTASLVRKDGYVGIYKGPLFVTEEKAFADVAAKKLSLVEDRVLEYKIYENEEIKSRYYVLYNKTGATHKMYPRANGMAKKIPLGEK